MSQPLPSEPDLARHMDAEARRTTGIRQDLGAPANAASGHMDVAAIIAGVLRQTIGRAEAEILADRIIAALDTAARAKPERQYAVNDVVQVSPTVRPFGGCLILVTEVLTWGVRGFVQGAVGGRYYARVHFGGIEHTGGRAVWAPPGEADGEGR